MTSVTIVNLAYGRRVFHPSLLGKLTTGGQLVTVGLVLVLNAAGRTVAPIRYLFLGAIALTVSSALHYVYLAARGRRGTPVAD